MRQDLHVDAGLVHLLEAQLAEVMQALEHLRIASGFEPDVTLFELSIPIVLLQRDDRAIRFLHHDALSPIRLL